MKHLVIAFALALAVSAETKPNEPKPMTPEQMDACWADKQMVSDLITTFQTNASADKIEGTPTFIINGETVQNQPWDELKKVLDTKVTEAEAKK